MACSTDRGRVVALLALAVATTGCFTGHVLDAARRREHPLAVRAAWREHDRLVLAWDAEVTTDLGEPLGRIARAGAIDVAALAGTEPVPAERVCVEPRPAERPVGPDARAADVAVVADGRGTPMLVLQDGGPPLARLPLDALATSRTAAWGWAVLPAAAALDVAVVPPLLFFAPAVIVSGD